MNSSPPWFSPPPITQPFQLKNNKNIFKTRKAKRNNGLKYFSKILNSLQLSYNSIIIRRCSTILLNSVYHILHIISDHNYGKNKCSRNTPGDIKEAYLRLCLGIKIMWIFSIFKDSFSFKIENSILNGTKCIQSMSLSRKLCKGSYQTVDGLKHIGSDRSPDCKIFQ